MFVFLIYNILRILQQYFISPPVLLSVYNGPIYGKIRIIKKVYSNLPRRRYTSLPPFYFLSEF